MKTKEIASRYSIDRKAFEDFLRNNDLDHWEGFSGISIDDSKVAEYVDLFNADIEKQKAEADEAHKAEIMKQQAMARMLISSGFSFEGYKIIKYSGYISGDDAVQVKRDTSSWFSKGKHGEDLTDALVQIRRQALKELKEAAFDLGCNAVIGVDFDYITLEPESGYGQHTYYEPYIICVTANGNAVVIEKEE